jgi:predicted glycosyltransferase involved in capsule biosynthesis
MINIILLFWDMGCEYRLENTKVSWSETKKFTEFLKSKNLECDCFLFEFGKNFIFEDSIKIEMDLDYYERSKKINLCLNYEVNDNCSFIAIMDSDTFFLEDDYESMYQDFLNITNSKFKEVYTYNLLDVNKTEREKIIDFSTHKIKHDLVNTIRSNFSWRHSFGAGTMGGFFICPIEELKKIGGFDEKYLTWGAEDDDALTRLKGTCSWMPRMWKGPAHLYHPKNTQDEKYYIKVYTDEYFKINKVKK